MMFQRNPNPLISTIVFCVLLFILSSLKLTTGINQGCMESSTTFFTKNLPKRNKGLVEYIDADAKNGILLPCPLDAPPERSCSKCSPKADPKCCANGVCPCVMALHEKTCQIKRPLIFNLQFYALNTSCHGLYYTWSIFDKTEKPGDEQEFAIIPVLDKTISILPVLNKYIYLTGFGAKNIEGYYVTFYVSFRICLGTFLRLLDRKFILNDFPKLGSLLDTLVGFDKCICEITNPLTSASLYIPKPDKVNLVENTELFTFISKKGGNPPTFKPPSAESREIRCTSNENCQSITCRDSILVRCCVSGFCKCVSNLDKKTCLPCSSNGIMVGGSTQCNLEGADVDDNVAIYKIKNNCNTQDNVNDVPFQATIIPDQSNIDLIIGDLIYTAPPHQIVWHGRLVLRPDFFERLDALL